MQTLGTLYACALLIDGLGHATRSATYLSANKLVGLDQRWTWIHIPLIRPRCTELAKPGRVKAGLIKQIGFSLVFRPYLSNAVVLAKSPLYFSCLVVLKLLVSLISRLVACSARIDVHRQADRLTDIQNDYCNPR